MNMVYNFYPYCKRPANTFILLMHCFKELSNFYNAYINPTHGYKSVFLKSKLNITSHQHVLSRKLGHDK